MDLLGEFDDGKLQHTCISVSFFWQPADSVAVTKKQIMAHTVITVKA